MPSGKARATELKHVRQRSQPDVAAGQDGAPRTAGQARRPLVTMGEGNTPLVKSVRLGPALGLRNLYFKLESVNPTGSYKDRVAAAAVSHAVETGLGAVIGTSSGNAGAAFAAYARRAQLPCYLIVLGDTKREKLAQIQAYGATVIGIHDFGRDPRVTEAVFGLLQQVAQERRWLLGITTNTHSPIGMRGIRAIAKEICRDLQGSPDRVFVPVGGGGLFASSWQGFIDVKDDGLIDRLPRMMAVHPSGAPFLTEARRRGRADIPPAECTSAISGLQIPRPPDAEWVLAAVADSGGDILAVSDEEILEAQAALARMEGILAEPAGAAAFAGLRHAVRAGLVDPGETVVCYVTGTGLKDLGPGSRLLRDVPEFPVIRADQLADALERLEARGQREAPAPGEPAANA